MGGVVVECGLWVVVVDGVVVAGWWLVVGGWWLVGGGWWVERWLPLYLLATATGSEPGSAPIGRIPPLWNRSMASTFTIVFVAVPRWMGDGRHYKARAELLTGGGVQVSVSGKLGVGGCGGSDWPTQRHRCAIPSGTIRTDPGECGPEGDVGTTGRWSRSRMTRCEPYRSHKRQRYVGAVVDCITVSER